MYKVIQKQFGFASLHFVSVNGSKYSRQLLDQSDANANAKTNRCLVTCVFGHMHLPRGLLFSQSKAEAKPRQSITPIMTSACRFSRVGTGCTTARYYSEFWLVSCISYVGCDLPDFINYFYLALIKDGKDGHGKMKMSQIFPEGKLFCNMFSLHTLHGD